MKLAIWFALALLPTLSTDAFEWKCCFPRVKWYGCWEVDTLNAKGIVELGATTVTKGLCVHGSVDAEHATIASAYIEGRATFFDSAINGDINIMGTGIFKQSKVAGITQIGGYLEGRGSHFCGGIQAASGYIELSNCTSPTIYMFPCAQEMQIVKLLNGTCIEGDIAFEADCGRVFIDRTSILNGTVIGGLIISDGE